MEPAAYRVFFEGRGHLDMLYDVQKMMAQLEGVEKGAGKGRSTIYVAPSHDSSCLLVIFIPTWRCPHIPGSNYLAWLSSARAALEAGISEFIARDFDSPMDMLNLGRLLPLLPRLNVLELLGQHHSRSGMHGKNKFLETRTWPDTTLDAIDPCESRYKN